jgi:hypothetical protein
MPVAPTNRSTLHTVTLLLTLLHKSDASYVNVYAPGRLGEKSMASPSHCLAAKSEVSNAQAKGVPEQASRPWPVTAGRQQRFTAFYALALAWNTLPTAAVSPKSFVRPTPQQPQTAPKPLRKGKDAERNYG